MNEFDNQEKMEADGIFSKILRAGRRTYFFDVRETRAGDYYLTITESKKNTGDDGSFFYKKHKIYLYKEDFESFKDLLDETTQYVFQNKGEEVISERHQKDFDTKKIKEDITVSPGIESFTNIDFEDI
ncbi:PUR family DNA/RNA-binding protein [Faecalibacter rhinopitheci]|uniref:PUR family DNA/RNA-binding protein n=1 Tax=Faecalibacter rhinopitheci TaxID=2779678 RepID=A0A8J7FQ80_9FLAO|nr:PUR family DNA/RNA-binding protein [Faecalibacter rhinopitheci]MBF0597474.1 PUR family DNA/RNA-binding protein [Faecalibacter rhinopitheci]MBQ0147503.1 PUR family DNA/RNA-binding protein [Candidatus Onthonaster equi]